jgi:GNAT superfamily N-acetyltransferase
MNGMTVNIRKAQPHDAATVAKLNIRLAAETEGRILDSRTVRCGVDAVLGDPGRGFYLIAETGGVVIGQCLITFEWSDWRCGFFWWIQSVYIRKDHRRAGILSRLYDTVLTMAQGDPDVTGLRLYVDRENQAAVAAYHSLGLQEARYILFEREFADALKNKGE